MSRGEVSRDEQRTELRSDVELMRELGVVRWKNIILGPPPVPADEQHVLTPEEREAREERAAEQRHRTLFAASSVVPKFVKAEKRGTVPESVVQSAARAREHGRGRNSA